MMTRRNYSKPSEPVVAQQCRLVPRDRIKVLTVMDQIIPDDLRLATSRSDAEQLLRETMIAKMGRSIVEALMEHDKVWFRESDGAFFASVEVIIPDPTHGPVGLPVDSFWIGQFDMARVIGCPACGTRLNRLGEPHRCTA